MDAGVIHKTKVKIDICEYCGNKSKRGNCKGCGAPR